MIPKKIHYCWFGHGQMPDYVIKCINSWQKNLPEYELILWNEDNFDINSNQYVKEAYESKKYAFVTDYVRLYALYYQGGIYMDTDVEVLKSLDKFLEHRAFTGCEDNNMCVTGIMGSEKKHPWIKKLLDNYTDKKFILPNGRLNTIANTKTITQLTIEEFGWHPENRHQVLNSGLNIYSFEVFCAKDWRTGEITVTDDTYTIHHFSGSWITNKDKIRSKKRQKIKCFITKIMGENGFNRLLKIRNKILGYDYV